MPSEHVAVLLSDCHLSHKPPIARSAEPDWYEAQARTWNLVEEIADGLPILCAGDVFDRWNPPPQLINFAMDVLPSNFYAVPGQHDLPHHNYNEREASAFHTLCLANRIQELEPDCGNYVGQGLCVWGYPWEFPLEGPDVSRKDRKDYLQIAVIHKYVWQDNHKHEHAADDAHVPMLPRRFTRQFDIMTFGDNHKGFYNADCNVFNCGTLMRRRIDEMDYRPQIGMLCEDGSVHVQYLDTDDKFVKHADRLAADPHAANYEAVVEGLRELVDQGIDFADEVLGYCRKHEAGKLVQAILEECLGGS